MQESHAATSALCKYICKPQFLHAFAYASPCKPMQARCKSRASSCRRMQARCKLETGTKSLPVLPKGESRLLEVVGSIPSMCLQCVSVVFRCVAAKYALKLVSASCLHLHMQARCKKLMQRFQRYASTYARSWYLHGVCMVFAWFCMVFAWELHAYASPMQFRRTASNPVARADALARRA